MLHTEVGGSSSGKIILFQEASLKRCKDVLSARSRSSKNEKKKSIYSEITLPLTPDDIRGYHSKCYSKFTAVPASTLLESPVEEPVYQELQEQNKAIMDRQDASGIVLTIMQDESIFKEYISFYDNRTNNQIQQLKLHQIKRSNWCPGGEVHFL